jgi:ABC-type uncharacterized transport system substrate-binding protein
MRLKTTFRYAAFMLFVLSIFSLCTNSLWADSTPRLNNGKKWRIGYYEGGPYSDYTDTMRTLVKGLIELGWIKDRNLPALFQEMAKPYWDWLSHRNSPFLSFRAEDSYSANWDEQKRARIRKTLLKKLKAGNLDLVIAMGTWAGKDLANNEHSVPTMVLSTSDPIKAGIIKSADSSGYDHVTTRVDPNRYLRQIRMFHRIVGFQTLGIAYENTSDGRIYSAVSDVYRIAKERNFTVITCEVIDATVDTQKSNHSCMECYRQLAQKADAVYVTALTCVDRLGRQIATIFRSAKVPSFSMTGSKFVRKGMMLSISSDSGYTELGRYNAMKFAEILNGTKPVRFRQVFEDPLDIAVNMQTVRQIGFDMPKSILSIATEIYDQ